MYAVTETAVVIDTCEQYLATLDEDSPLADEARRVLELLRADYRLNRDNLNSSL